MNRAGLLSGRNVAVYVAALALLVFTTFPFLWMASTAFKVSNEIFATPPTSGRAPSRSRTSNGCSPRRAFSPISSTA